MIKNYSKVQNSLVDWFNRRTNANAVRRVGLSSIALSTDIGITRSENQDRCAVLRTRSGDDKAVVVIAVCDGMGGMASGGDCASRAITSFFLNCSCSPYSSLEKMLSKAAFFANEEVYSIHSGQGGSTLSAIAIDHEGKLAGVNVGDSRLYLRVKSELLKISNDDTLSGQFSPSAGIYNDTPGLLQYMGIGKEISPHIIEIAHSNENDYQVIITSDGVHFLGSSVMGAIIQNASDSAKAAQRLTDLSKWCGGNDNATTAIFSSYKKLIEFRGEAKKGLIEIWDAFGELQVIVDTSEQGLNPEPNPTPSKPHSPIEASLKKIRKRKRPEIKDPPETENDSAGPPVKPQIKIEFDESNGL
jgi:serine/threonine protein phosphatase PrpC